MPRLTKEPTRKPAALSEHFPYSAEFECPSCGRGWQLEEGDAWGITSVESKLAAVAQCPEDGCGAFAVATGGRGEMTASPPAVRLIRTDALPVPAAQPERRRRPAPVHRDATQRAEAEPFVPSDEDLEEAEGDDPLSEELGLRFYKNKRPANLPAKLAFEDIHQAPQRRVALVDGGEIRTVTERK